MSEKPNRYPEIALASTQSSIEGTLRVACAPYQLRVRLPSWLRIDGAAVASSRSGDDVIFTMPSDWRVE